MRSSKFLRGMQSYGRNVTGHSSDSLTRFELFKFWAVPLVFPAFDSMNCVLHRHVIFLKREKVCLVMYSRQAQDNISSQKVESLRRYQSFCVHTLCPSTLLIHGLAQGWARARRLQRLSSRERVLRNSNAATSRRIHAWSTQWKYYLEICVQSHPTLLHSLCTMCTQLSNW